MARAFTIPACFILLSISQAAGQDTNFSAENVSFDPCQAVGKASLFKPLGEIPTRLMDDGGRMPPDCSRGFFVSRLAGDEGRFDRDIAFHWEPTNFFHMPTYFDDVPLERYGQTWNAHLQPAVSGAKFVLQIPAWPYKMGVDRPHACVTTLGHQPPGNCLPCMRQTLPCETDAAFLEAAAAVGLVFLLP